MAFALAPAPTPPPELSLACKLAPYVSEKVGTFRHTAPQDSEHHVAGCDRRQAYPSQPNPKRGSLNLFFSATLRFQINVAPSVSACSLTSLKTPPISSYPPTTAKIPTRTYACKLNSRVPAKVMWCTDANRA